VVQGHTMKEYAYTEKPFEYTHDEWKEYKRIVDSFTVFDVPKEHQQWILEALHDICEWEWYEDCNGANFVSEHIWKTKYHPAYVYHDYAWSRWGATLRSNKRMWLLQNDYGMSKFRSSLRWLGVTAFGMPVSWIKSLFC